MSDSINIYNSSRSNTFEPYIYDGTAVTGSSWYPVDNSDIRRDLETIRALYSQLKKDFEELKIKESQYSACLGNESKTIKELQDTLETVYEDYEKLSSQVDLQESKSELQEVDDMTYEEKIHFIKPGMTVWSMSTKQGPYITIVENGSKHASGSTFGWIVKNNKGKEITLPLADLTLVKPVTEPKSKIPMILVLLILASIFVSAKLYVGF